MFKFAIWLTVMMIASIGCSTRHTLPDWLNLSGLDDSQQYAAVWETSHKEALQKSQATGKPMLMWFTGSDWCSWCVKLDEEVFQTMEFREWSGDHVIPLMLDFPRQTPLAGAVQKQNEQLREKYAGHITGYPTALLVAADGTVIGKLGYLPGGPKKWIASAQQQLNVSQPVLP